MDLVWKGNFFGKYGMLLSLLLCFEKDILNKK